MFEELAQSEVNCLILIQTLASSEDISSDILAFLSCQMHHANTKQQYLHNSFDFVLFPLNCHSILSKSCQELGIAPTISNSSPTLFHK
ncbi:hypothetical protein LguiA_034869 [Lonicera macranthoides]